MRIRTSRGPVRRRAVTRTAVTACLATAACLLSPGAPAGRPGGPASVPAGALTPDALRSVALWPKPSPPRTVIAADATRLTGPDLLTATTLQGVYNGSRQGSRLYLTESATDRFWLSHLPSGVRVQTIPAAGSGDGLLRALLTRFRTAVKGAIVASPSNPGTVNLATTMAGFDGSVVIFPGQERLAASLGIPIRYRFDTPVFSGDSPVQTYRWGVRHLLPKTSTRLEVALSGSSYGTIRDYAVSSRAFVYWLTSTHPAQRALLDTITGHTPANTPVMGYLPDENPDVADISAAGHFLNGSNTVTNESFWSSLPSPPFLRQPGEPAPIRAGSGTVYVAFMMSDGDNEDLLQERMPRIWSDKDLGAVPAGWTVAPGALEFAPSMMRYYYRTLPPDSEFVAAPSGIGYVSEEGGPDLIRFDRLTSEIMARDDLKTVDTYEPPDQLPAEAGGGTGPADPPAALSKNTPLLPEQSGRTFIAGQTSGYIGNRESQYCAIGQQAAAEHRGGAPLFLEPMIDVYDYGPADLLHMAQQLARAGRAAGARVVFTTPTELALTMKRYYAGRESGLPAGNVQSETGAQVLARPPAGPPYPSGPATITGPNLIANPSGASGTSGWHANGGTLQAASYQGRPALHWTSHVAAGQSWADYVPGVTNGKTYTYTVDVAGSGQVFLDGYNGKADEDTLPVRLTPDYRKLTWTVTVPPGAPGPDNPYYAPQLEVRQSGGPVSVYIAGASVAASTPAC